LRRTSFLSCLLKLVTCAHEVCSALTGSDKYMVAKRASVLPTDRKTLRNFSFLLLEDAKKKLSKRKEVLYRKRLEQKMSSDEKREREREMGQEATSLPVSRRDYSYAKPDKQAKKGT